MVIGVGGKGVGVGGAGTSVGSGMLVDSGAAVATATSPSSPLSTTETAMVAAGVGKLSSFWQAARAKMNVKIQKIGVVFFTRLLTSFFNLEVKSKK
jgi:hypothetical protein